MNFKLGVLLFCLILLHVSCSDSNDDENDDQPSFFLSELRPEFFNNINFNSEEARSNISDFLSDFKETYEYSKNEYDEGLYVSEADLDNFRLFGMYYSFALTAVTRAYLDEFIEFSDITGANDKGLYTNLATTSDDFKQKELEAMMDKSNEVAYFSMYVNGFNDKNYGCYLVSRQIRQRVASDENFNYHMTQDSVINYVDSKIYDYRLYSEWNSIMSQLSFTNFNDSLNTFKNPRMDVVLENLNKKLVIGSIPDLNGRYAEILGPTYRFDINFKKIQWMLNDNNIPNNEEVEELSKHLQVLVGLRDYILIDKQLLLDDWDYKATLQERFDKVSLIQDYITQLQSSGDLNHNLDFEPFFTSKNFLQAYQCYNCHKPVSLN